MNQDGNDLLAGLRDIHGAAEPAWWPPAPGWWLLAAAALVLLSLVLRWLFRKWSEHRRRQRFLAALERIERTIDPGREPREYIAQINRLFRAVALRAFAGRDPARLQGDAWVGFIRAGLPGEAAGESLRALATGPYEPRPEFDARALADTARAWVRRHG